MINLGEEHEDLEVRGQVVDLFGRPVGNFKDKKIFRSDKHIASIRGPFLLDREGKRIADLRKIRSQVNQDAVDLVVAAIWLLAR